jgi:cytochrome bd ubiquinol oxidase subunit II
MIDGIGILQLLWFFVIALLFAGFLFLEGIDFGVGMATRFVASDVDERAIYMRAVAPHWDGNEVWLITAGGAMFAAFPLWYASLFSGYYLLLFLVLVGLILRGVSFEFSNHSATDGERNIWQWANFIGSIVPPFFLGMMLTSMIQGIPMGSGPVAFKNGKAIGDASNAMPGFFDVVNPLSVVGGIAVVFFCFVHGLHFLSLKLSASDSRHMLTASSKVYWIAYPALVVFVLLVFFCTDFYQKRTISSLVITVIILAAVICGHVAARHERGGYAFIASGVTLAGVIAFIFNGLFPRVMISKDGTADLLIKDAAASPLTSKTMTIVLCCLLPIMLVYFIWSYYIQRKRLYTDDMTDEEKKSVIEYGA